MKKINIYLIANEQEVEQDKIELENFINNLNDKYNKGYEIYFELINDENFENLDEEKIKNSDLFYILFCNEIDKQNINKFNIAYNNFLEKLTPKITTYIKNSDKPAGESVNEFLERIDKELGHYHSVYNNVDTIKLNLILKLQNLELQLEDIKTEDGKLYIGNQEIMSIENIPMIMNNNDLQSLKTELQELEEKYWKLRDKIRKNETEEDLENYRKISARRKKAKEDTFELEKNIIDLEKSFVGMSTKGMLSQRQIYAKKCLDAGKIEEAKKTLDFEFEKIKSEAEKILQFKESKKEELRINVNELIQRINTLKLDISNANRFEEIEKTFEEAIRIEKEGGLYRKNLIDYAEYLSIQNKIEKSIEYAEMFLNYVDLYYSELLYNVKNVNYDISRIYELLGTDYMINKKLTTSQIYYEKAINKKNKLIKEKKKMDENYKASLANTYDKLAQFYVNTSTSTIQWTYHEQALKIREELAEKNPEIYNGDLAESYDHFAVFCIGIDSKKSEEFQKKAIQIREKLVQSNPEKYYKSLSDSYNNMAELYNQCRYLDNSEEFYKKSINIREKLVKENPEAYSKCLADVYNNYAYLLCCLRKYSKSEEYYKKAIEIQEKLLNENIEIYSKDLIKSYKGLINLYENSEQNNKIEECYKKIIRIHEKLVKKIPNEYVYKVNLAKEYNILGNFYVKKEKYELAEKYYKSTIFITRKILENVKKYNANLINGIKNCNTRLLNAYIGLANIHKNNKDYLIEIYNKIAEIYMDIKKYEDAEYYCNKALEIHKNSNKIDDNYEAILAKLYNNLSNIYDKLHAENEAEAFSKLSLEIREKLFKDNPNLYVKDLIESYHTLGNIYSNMEQNLIAFQYYTKEAEIMERLITNKTMDIKNLIDIYDNIIDEYYQNDRDGFRIFFNLISDLCEGKLKEEESDIYKEILATAHGKIASFYKNQYNSYFNIYVDRDDPSIKYHEERISEIKNHYREALKLYENLNQNNENIVILCSEFSDILIKEEEYEEAEKYCQIAINIKEKMAEKNPGENNIFLSIIYEKMAFICNRIYSKNKQYKYMRYSNEYQEKSEILKKGMDFYSSTWINYKEKLR